MGWKWKDLFQPIAKKEKTSADINANEAKLMKQVEPKPKKKKKKPRSGVVIWP